MEAKKRAALMILEFMSIVLDQNKAKQCALAAVNLLLEDIDVIIDLKASDYDAAVAYNFYWQNVKEEIEKL